jgi:putative membrane protein
MGSADIIPGVSGGTVALILGVYERLLGALSLFDSQFVRLVLTGKLGEAWRHIDAWFLLALAAGVGTGVKGLAGVMSYLLTEQTTYTYAAFFGLILASGWLVARLAKPETPLATARCVAIGLVAAIFAVWLMSQGRMTPLSGLPYTFACGVIAICAMILPGISGAYLLLILGKYEEMSGILHRAPSISGYEWASLAVFLTGCLVGILSMSRVLKWLLSHYWSSTMAALAGFMIGSLYRIWPFQVDTTPEVEEFALKVLKPVVPDSLNSQVLTCVGIGLFCFVAVFVIEWLGRRVSETAPQATTEKLASEAS